MATRTPKGGTTAGAQLPAGALDRIAAELTTRRRPMTIAELLELIGQ